MISTYIHNAYKKNIGKIAVVLKSKINEIDEESKILGKNLCMHIAASKPFALSIEKLNKNLIKKEREIQIETIKSSGKPNNILEKILEGKMKKFYLIFLLIFLISSCKTIDRKIDTLSKEEEKNLNRFLGKPQIELIDEFGTPDDVIHYEGDNKVLVFRTKKYQITCERKFEINNKRIIIGFNSRNCF